jgi:hypothetical protein
MSNYRWSNSRATTTSCSNCEDGKIVSGKEFLDVIHVNEIFGAPCRSFVTGIKVDSVIAINRKT